jgi:hypothetical protein
MDKVKAMEEEIERRVAAMSEEQRNHLRALIYEFVKCYEDEGKDSAVIILGTPTSVDNLITVNCNHMEAMQLMLTANDIFGHLNTRGAPPKEKFN